MKIEPKAFLAIENTMSAAMHAEWDKIAEGITSSLSSAIHAGDWARAQDVANKLTLKGVVSRVRPRLEELATSALIFGAHRASGDVRQTAYAKGEPLPDELRVAIDQLEHAVEEDAADYIRRKVHATLAEAMRGDATQHFQKSADNDAKLTDDAEQDDRAFAEDGGLDSADEDDATVKRNDRAFGRTSKFDPDEPRASDGEWTAGGQNGSAATATGAAVVRPSAGAQAPGLQVNDGVRGGPIGLAAPGSADLATPLKGLPTKIKLDGKPLNIGPYVPARQAAYDYAKSVGLDYHPPTEYAKVDEARATRIAQAYDEMKNDPHDPNVKAAYGALIKECMGQWNAAMATGLKIDFIPDHAPDPYAKSPRLMTEDVRNNNHMWVYPTASGFGTDHHFDASENPLLGDAGIVINGHHLVYNDVFRIVHDFFGHVKEGNGFRADGEENAWRSHSAMFTPLARRALTSETRGQNSWVNYGPYGATNRTADAAHTHFADQKVGIMPEWTQREGSGLPEDAVTKFDPQEARDTNGKWIESGVAERLTTLAGARPAANDVEQASLNKWKGDGFGPMNDELRNKSHDTADTLNVKSWLSRAALPADTVLWRGISGWSAFGYKMMHTTPGDVVTDPGFMSSTPSEVRAKTWAGESPVDLVLKINAKKGQKAALVARPDKALVDNEGEVLIQAGSSLKVISVDKVKRIVECDLVQGPLTKGDVANEPRDADGKWTGGPNSKAFKAWFGASKAVSDDGSPKVFYHGTPNDFSTFDKDKIGSNFENFSFGIHFTDKPSEAGVYSDPANGVSLAAEKFNPASPWIKPIASGASIMPVYLKALHPLEITTNELTASMEADLNKAAIIKKIVMSRRAGKPYDSVIIKTKGDPVNTNIIVFDPKQIKSATGNSGKFDPDSADITKDDVSSMQLAAAGGLMSPEQTQSTAKTLYVKRRLINAEDLIAWAKANGFDKCLQPDDMHVTVCYSKKPMDWSKVTPKTANVTNVGERELKQFGDVTVLAFDAPVLEGHHDRFMSAGGSHDYPRFNPHVSITWNKPDDLDISKIEPYSGPLVFGPEEFKEIKPKWADGIVEKYDEDEPRDTQGRWASSKMVDKFYAYARDPKNDGIFSKVKVGLNPVDPETVELEHINVKASEQRKGLGDKMMRAIGRLADMHGVHVQLRPEPSGGTPGDVLRTFYAKHGYGPVYNDPAWMIRSPSTVKKAENTNWDLVGKLNDAVKNGGKVAADLGAQLTTSRLITLGFLSQAQKMGADLYQVDEVLDDRTCPVCLYMNGKTFRVANQFARTVMALKASDPAALKSIAPWPGQGEDDLDMLYAQSPDELQLNGLGAPPYHPNCRGMLALVGTVEESIPLGGPAATIMDEPDDVTPDDRPDEPASLTDQMESGVADAEGVAEADASATEAEPEDGWSDDKIETLRDAIDQLGDETIKNTAMQLLDQGDYDAALDVLGTEAPDFAADKGWADDDDVFGDPDDPYAEPGDPKQEDEVLEDADWSIEDIQDLGWQRFKVKDPAAFAKVDKAYQAGLYNRAKEMIDQWIEENGSDDEEFVKTEDAIPPTGDDNGFEGPNAPRKKRKLQVPAGREQDYGDITPDSSAIAFESGMMNDVSAPIDRE